MNMKQLEAFVYVAEEKNFTRAAKLLYMTQPAISFQIKALEEHLGVQLFERMDKKVYLTDGGEILYHEAKKILAAYELIKDGIVELKGLEKGRMNIGASTIPGEYLLPRLIGDFKSAYPNLLVSLEIGSTGSMIRRLEEREIDIAIIGAKPEEKKFETYRLSDDELILIAPPNFGREYLTVENLISQPLIFREKGSGTRKIIEDALKTLNIPLEKLNIPMELGTTRAVLTAVQSGLGLSFVSKWAIKEAEELNNIKVIKVEGLNIRRYFYVALNPNKYNSSAIKAFRRFLIESTVS